MLSRTMSSIGSSSETQGLGAGLPSLQGVKRPALRQPSNIFTMSDFSFNPEISLSLEDVPPLQLPPPMPDLKPLPSYEEENFPFSQTAADSKSLTELPFLGLPLPTSNSPGLQPIAPLEFSPQTTATSRPKKRTKRVQVQRQQPQGKTTYKMLIGDTWYHVPNGYMLVRNTLI
jgi:hypothetical protein